MTQGLTRKGFQFDIQLFQSREETLANILHIALGGTVELKSDELTRNTGNIFIEYRQKGRPSGIAVTKAVWWAIEYNTHCYIIVPTDILKGIARVAYQDPSRRRSGGDNNNYEGVVVPLSWVTKPPASVMSQVKMPV